MSPPFVSILIPCYNAAPWVAQAIESALAQDWENLEVIVLDDGSSDGSLEVIRRYEERVQIISQANSGQNVTRNRLTELSRGEWLFYLDADDEMMPGCVQEKMKFADVADVIYGSMETLTFEGARMVSSEQRVAINHDDPIFAAIWWAFPNTTAMAFRKAVILKTGGWDESLKNCTDYGLYFQLLLSDCRFYPAPASWTVYRMWSDTQAVKEAPVRLMTTRLRLMEFSSVKLKAGGMWSERHEQALFDASLGSLRLLYTKDSGLALKEYHEYMLRHPGCRPSSEIFSRLYLLCYRVFGFGGSEWLAAVARRMIPDTFRRCKYSYVPGTFSTDKSSAV